MSVYDISGNSLAEKYKSRYDGKTLSILGDSISTYAGYIPSGNANYYTGSNCGVSSVNDTWWMKLMTALGMTLNLNNSWSGSRVTTTNGSESAGCMTRCQNLGTAPDVIIVYMGINDFNNEVGLGTYDGNGSFPTSTTTFRESYAIMLDKIMTAYPTSEIWCATLQACEKNGATGAPEKNGNNVLLDDFNKAIRNLAQVFGAKILEHAQCGLTYENMSIYMGDYESVGNTGLHPNADGHTLIANNDIRQLTYEVSNESSGEVNIPWTDVTGTLTAGATSITLSSASITTNSTIEVFTSADVDYNSVSVSNGSVTITFDAQSSNMGVKVRVS